MHGSDAAVWDSARRMYRWEARLGGFSQASRYPGFFVRTVGPDDVTCFEDLFRAAIRSGGKFPIAGEVCFWKNYGSPKSRDRITASLLSHLENIGNWGKFCDHLENLRITASYRLFDSFKIACNQPSGFATPITFLAFLDPQSYPMLDKHIACWWNMSKSLFGYEQAPTFVQRDDGWVGPGADNWAAYVAWTAFTREMAGKMNWRARDVEMAVWEAQKRGIPLGTF